MGGPELTAMLPAGTVKLEGRGSTTSPTVAGSPCVLFPMLQVSRPHAPPASRSDSVGEVAVVTNAIGVRVTRGMDSKPRHDFVYASAERSRLYGIPVSPQISTRGLSRVEGFIMPRRRMVARRADAYRVQLSELRTSVNEFVMRFVGAPSLVYRLIVW
jgi:hypothetical protein